MLVLLLRRLRRRRRRHGQLPVDERVGRGGRDGQRRGRANHAVQTGLVQRLIQVQNLKLIDRTIKVHNKEVDDGDALCGRLLLFPFIKKEVFAYTFYVLLYTKKEAFVTTNEMTYL